MICGQHEIHNGKKDTKTALSETFVIMVVAQLLCARREAKSSEVVMKYLLSLFL